MKPLEASLFKSYCSPELREALIRSDVVPVNDKLLPVWDMTNSIIMLYGSYGSGKSVFVADKWIDKAINQPYFRGYFGRKILEDVRKSVYKTITDRIKELHKEHLFHFSNAPNGSMIIVCRKNGNEMHPFGANDTESMKSIKDPTDFYCEELDQFTFEDFKNIYSRLRKEGVLLQFWAAFNTEKVYKSHWIRRMLFDGEMADMAFKYKVNYTDNYFIDQEEYYKKLLLISGGDAVLLNAIARGEWGLARTGGEFLKKFNETNHVKKVDYRPGQVWLTLDDNVVPYTTCLGFQVQGKNIRQITEQLGRTPDNNAPKLAHKVADWLSGLHHNDKVVVCGDPSAKRRSTVDENSKSFYDKFIEVLRARGFIVEDRVMKSAPQVALSGAFLNAIFEQNLFGWSISISDMCFESIEDYLLVKEDAEGKMMKEEVKDPVTDQKYQKNGHCTDALRYLVLTICANEFDEYRGISSNVENQIGYFYS